MPRPLMGLNPEMLRIAVLAIGLSASLLLSGGAAHAAEVRAVRVGAHTDMTRVVLDISERIPFRVSPASNGDVIVIKLPKVAWRTRASRRLNTGLAQGYRHDVVDGESIVTFSLKRPVSVRKSFAMPPDGDGGYRIVIDLVAAEGAAAMPSAGFSRTPAGNQEPAVETAGRSAGPGTAAPASPIRFNEIAQVNNPASFQQWLEQEQYNPNLYKAREWYRRSRTAPKPYTPQQLKLDLEKAKKSFLKTQASPLPYRPRQPLPVRSQRPLPDRMVARKEPVEGTRQTVVEHSNEPDAGLGRFYVGGHLGYGLATYDALYNDGTDTVEVDGLSGEGPNIGSHIGIGRTFDRTYVGAEVEYDYGNVATSVRINSNTADLTRDHSFMLTGRLGYHFAPNALGYMRLGASQGRWRSETSAGFDETVWLTGMAFGVGLDYAPGSSYSVRGEILGINYEEYDKTVGSERVTVDPTVYNLRVGLDYQF